MERYEVHFEVIGMAFDPQRGAFGARPFGMADTAVVDQALRQYMLRVYNIMASGLLLSGIVAVALALSPTAMSVIFGSGFGIIAMLLPLGILMVMSFGMNRMQARTVELLYWLFVASFGLSLSTIFVVYRLGSVAQVFFITAGTFGAMSLYGYTTGRDLTRLGSFLFMALIGLIIAMVVNLFLHSTGFGYLISFLGVLIFTGLTAYDTQRIKSQFYASEPSEVMTKRAVMSAVQLYLDFINLFMLLLNIMGQRR